MGLAFFFNGNWAKKANPTTPTGFGPFGATWLFVFLGECLDVGSELCGISPTRKVQVGWFFCFPQ